MTYANKSFEKVKKGIPVNIKFSIFYPITMYNTSEESLN